MQELFDLIGDLLDAHTCVIVPNFGGFVTNDKSAEKHSENDSFCPPTKEVIFNQLLTHNDGLLAQELMRRNQLSFEDANRQIATIVSQIQQTLASVGTLKVSDWGLFTMESQRLSFVQTRSFLVDKDAFGLNEFYFPELMMEDKSEEIVEQPKRNSMKPFLIGTAATIACLMFFHPLHDGMDENSKMINQSSMLLTGLKSEVELQTKTINVLQSELDSYKKSPVGFYLILADFPSKNAAYDYLDEEGLEDDQRIQIITIDNRFYVSVASSLEKNDLMQKKNSLSNDLYDLDQSYVLSVAKMND